MTPMPFTNQASSGPAAQSVNRCVAASRIIKDNAERLSSYSQSARTAFNANARVRHRGRHTRLGTATTANAFRNFRKPAVPKREVLIGCRLRHMPFCADCEHSYVRTDGAFIETGLSCKSHATRTVGTDAPFPFSRLWLANQTIRLALQYCYAPWPRGDDGAIRIFKTLNRHGGACFPRIRQANCGCAACRVGHSMSFIPIFFCTSAYSRRTGNRQYILLGFSVPAGFVNA